MQYGRIRKAIAKVLEKDISLVEKTRTLFYQECITVILKDTILSMTISTVVISIIVLFRGSGGDLLATLLKF